MKLGEGITSNQFFATMTLNEPGYIYLSAQQQYQNHYKDFSGYRYSYVRMFVFEVGPDGKRTFIKGKTRCVQSTVIKGNFKKGNYLIYIEVDWKQAICNILNLSAYSSTRVDFKEENPSNYDKITLYEEVMTSYIKSAKGKGISTNLYQYSIISMQGIKYDLTGILFQNKEKHLTLHSKVMFTTLENIKVLTPNISGNIVEIVLPPESEKIMILDPTSKEPNIKINFDYKESYSIVSSYTDQELRFLCKAGNKQSILNDKINLYKYEYKGGQAFLFVNPNSTRLFQLKIKFDIKNMRVNGEDINSTEIYIPPGEDHLINLFVKDPYNKYKFNLYYDGSFVDF